MFVKLKKGNQYGHHIDGQLLIEMSNLTWCKLAGNTMSWVCWGWAGGVVAGAGVGGLLLPPAAVVKRAVVAMVVSPRLLMLLSVTANHITDIITSRLKVYFSKDMYCGFESWEDFFWSVNMSRKEWGVGGDYYSYLWDISLERDSGIFHKKTNKGSYKVDITMSISLGAW